MIVRLGISHYLRHTISHNPSSRTSSSRTLSVTPDSSRCFYIPKNLLSSTLVPRWYSRTSETIPSENVLPKINSDEKSSNVDPRTEELMDEIKNLKKEYDRLCSDIKIFHNQISFHTIILWLIGIGYLLS